MEHNSFSGLLFGLFRFQRRKFLHKVWWISEAKPRCCPIFLLDIVPLLQHWKSLDKEQMKKRDRYLTFAKWSCSYLLGRLSSVLKEKNWRRKKWKIRPTFPCVRWREGPRGSHSVGDNFGSNEQRSSQTSALRVWTKPFHRFHKTGKVGQNGNCLPYQWGGNQWVWGRREVFDGQKKVLVALLIQLAVREVVCKFDFLKPESLQSPAWHAPEVSATLARSSVHKSGKVDILEQKKGTLELRRYPRANMRAVSLVVGAAGH